MLAADVYGMPPHEGRGGWSWYTGSAGWMYRLIVESLLGVQRSGDCLHMRPLLPAHWPGFTLHYRYGATPYQITVRRTAQPEQTIDLDGLRLEGDGVPLRDDDREHHVDIQLPLNLISSPDPVMPPTQPLGITE